MIKLLFLSFSLILHSLRFCKNIFKIEIKMLLNKSTRLTTSFRNQVSKHVILSINKISFNPMGQLLMIQGC